MSKLSARTGWDWVKQGVALFRKQSLGLSVLFFGYMMITFWLGLIPLVGKMLSFALIPVFTAAFMQGCANADQGKRVHPGLLLTGFRSPAFPTLARLGLVYLGVAALATALSSFVDDGILLKVMTHQIAADAPEAKSAELGRAVLFSAALQLGAFVLLAFSAPLVLWKGMGVGKAVFYSVFGILGAIKPFLVFALAWFGISAVMGQIVFLIAGQSSLLTALLVPVSLIFTIVVFCSFYAIYRQLFGAPQQDIVVKDEATL